LKRRILVIGGVVALLIVVSATTAFFVWRAARQGIAQQVLKPKETVVDLSVLVSQVRELNRLETASMRVLHVGRVTQTYKLVPDALAGDEITFLAAGDVIAGIDLSQLKASQVSRSPDGMITLVLPPPTILVTRVDNRESKVLTRKTGALRRADVDLETRARQHAEENIRAEAIKKGILPMASKNAEKKLADFLHTLGFTRVRFVSGPARVGTGTTIVNTER
jgi:hypothetical protein